MYFLTAPVSRKELHEFEKKSFDDFLLDCAEKEGAKVENTRIEDIKLENGRPIIFSKKGRMPIS